MSFSRSRSTSSTACTERGDDAMTLTPVELRHVKPSKALFGGYDRDMVDRLLDEIVASFEDVWRERADMADKVEKLENDLIRYREIEGLLRTTLVSAEKAAVTLKEQARKEADLILEEARSEARSITRLARADHDRLLGEVRRMRSLLRSALAIVDDQVPEEKAA
ncbi:MAG: DivIVA domain-containing protein [Actinobacteria bacterium]|nr:MAG: DivIVA domain-containing protein [Actinomycetota bacterium]